MTQCAGPARHAGATAWNQANRVGMLFLLLSVFKLGWLAQFLPRAVVTEFLFGAALDVVIGELLKITGHLRRTVEALLDAGRVRRSPRSMLAASTPAIARAAQESKGAVRTC
jgi:hypothetical protein